MSAPTIDQLITAVRADLLSVPGVRRVYDELPQALNGQFPALLVFTIEGSSRFGSHSGERGRAMRWTVATLVVQVHVSAKSVTNAEATLTPLIDPVVDYLFAGQHRDAWQELGVTLGDPRMANNATAPVNYSIAGGEYGGEQTVALEVQATISLNQEIGHVG